MFCAFSNGSKGNEAALKETLSLSCRHVLRERAVPSYVCRSYIDGDHQVFSPVTISY